MLGCTSARLDSLMRGRSADRIFHYLPSVFVPPGIARLSFFLRESGHAEHRLTKIPNDCPRGSVLFSNVPAVLERCAAVWTSRSRKKAVSDWDLLAPRVCMGTAKREAASSAMLSVVAGECR